MKKIILTILVLITIWIWSLSNTYASFSDNYTLKVNNESLKTVKYTDQDKKDLIFLLKYVQSNPDYFTVIHNYLIAKYNLLLQKIIILTKEEKRYCEYLYVSGQSEEIEAKQCEGEYKKIWEDILKYKRSVWANAN